MIRTTFLTVAAGLLAASLMAQETDPDRRRFRRGPGIDKVTSFLQLSEEQAAQLRAVQQGVREDSRGLLRQIGENGRKLREELNKESPSASEVGFLTVEIHNLRKQIGELRGAAKDEALAVLSDEQKQLLQELEEARKLAPTIHEAQALHLLEGASPGRGPGPGGPGFLFGGSEGPRGGFFSHRGPRFGPRGR